MGFLLRISHLIDVINTWIGKTSGWLLLLAVLISAVNAIVRKVFSVSSNAWLDAQWYLFGAVFMLCASYTLLKNGHVRIDLISNRLSKRTRDLIDLFGHLFFLLPLTVLMVIESAPFALESYHQREGSANAGGLLVWPAKLLILVGFALLFVQAISEIIKRLAVLTGQLDDSEADPDTPDRPEMDLAEESRPPQSR
ncbi:MAG: TRAP transporter small permease subunit [Burkholderiaceae bacterium]|uniref:TRAP transporter small permease subunit n=1 Tax=Castellaniella sp. TaxID=1955812 RepID=UPI00355E5DC8